MIRLYLVFFFVSFSKSYSQQIIINEFMASNVTIFPEMYDFDDYSDWIELYNPNEEAVNLQSVFLTDNFDIPTKWKLPENTIIEPGGFLIIWCDDFNEVPERSYIRPYWPWDDFLTKHYHTNFKLNKDGENIGIFQAEESTDTLIHKGSSWTYLDNGSNQGVSWIYNNFNESEWNEGTAEFGYGDNDEETQIDYGEDENYKHITTYFRYNLVLNQFNDNHMININLKRDDGAVVYINGNEVLRSNMPEGEILFDTFASSSVSGNEEDIFFNYPIASNDFIQGDNLIAVELHQYSRTSSDVSFDFELILTQYENTILIDSISYGPQISDVSYGREPDNGSWKFFGEPTPGMINNSIPSSILEYSGDVVSSLSPGFYNNSQTLYLSSQLIDEVIYYTLDGSTPSRNSLIYEEPITLSETSVLKARSFESLKLPGKILVSTYFINEEHNLPTISLAVNPETLWDENIGILENEFKQREVPATFQYFTQGINFDFSINAGMRLGGLNIWTKPQKPFTIYTRDRFGEDFIQYQLFAGKQISEFSRIVFRNGGDDWEETLIRDPMTESLVSGMMKCGYMAYTPSSLFLNGAYWGIYNIREKFDTQYFSENFNIDPDNFDHLEYTQTQNGVQLNVIEGNSDSYQSLINYIINNDINQPEIYNQIENWVNLDSFIDHILMTIFCANTSWEHNREWWRSKVEGEKWNWLIVDLDRGFNINNLSRNLLDDLMEDYDLFRYLLDNTRFKNRFAQRSSAHLNHTFSYVRIENIVDSLSNIIMDEMPNHINRWGEQGGISSMSAWTNELNDIKQFSLTRGVVVKDQFINELNLDGMIELSVNTNIEGSGKILINNVPIFSGEAQGTYFKNIPITLEALSHPGYQFIGWEGISDSTIIDFDGSMDASFHAIFQLSEEIILPEIISENMTLSNEQPYAVIENLTVLDGVTLSIDHGSEIRMPLGGNILIEGKLIINGNEDMPVKIKTRDSNVENRWGALCFNNTSDTSIISFLNISGASVGINPSIHLGAISSINSNIILDNIFIEDVIFPIYVEGGSVSLLNSSINCDFICDYINVKNGVAKILNSKFYGSSAPNTDAIDLDNVTNAIIKNNHIYNFKGQNSDGIDVGQGSNGVDIIGNLIYHSYDKGISVGQGSDVHIKKNLIVGCNEGVSLKDNSQAVIINNTFANNDTSIHCFEKNQGQGGGHATIKNSIIYNSNFQSVVNDSTSSAHISYSLSNTENMEGESNLFLDPLFIDESIYNFEISSNSPCINNGDPSDSTDVGGSPIDIGAYYIYDMHDYPFQFEPLNRGLVINELLASNNSIIMDEHGDYDDWVELYNPTDSLIFLSGLYLSDDENDKTKWQFFDESLTLESNGYLLIWCDNEDNLSSSDLHTNFKLNASGESLFLIDIDGVTIIDEITFGEQEPDISFGRSLNNEDYWSFMNPTPGSSNIDLKVDFSKNIPNNYVLHQNFPNPFNASTRIRYDLPMTSIVNITIHDMMGKRVRNYNLLTQEPGKKEIIWNGDNNQGKNISAGIYLYSIEAGKFKQTRKMVLLK